MHAYPAVFAGCLAVALAGPSQKEMTARDMFYAPRAEASSSTQRLGLRYSILKESGDGATAEVDPDGVFRSGDRIRVSVRTNADAHLYIVQRGSSGNWSVLFPSPETAGGSNLVRQDVACELPPGHWFTFDEQAGQERIFIVLSRTPERDLEQLIYAVRRDGEAGDAAVGRIRDQTGARDLAFEKVTPQSAGEKKEQAVYVVNKTADAASRVVVDVTLNHR